LSCIISECSHQQRQAALQEAQPQTVAAEHNNTQLLQLQHTNDLALPPGFIIRSSAWDTQPTIRWKDLGRPKTILNLRENCETSSYEQLMLVDANDNDDGNDDDEGVSNNGTKAPNVWRISAENNIEKYDLSLTGSRDWLISVLQRLLRDDDGDGALSSYNEDDDDDDDENLWLAFSSLSVPTTSNGRHTPTFDKSESVLDTISNNNNNIDNNNNNNNKTIKSNKPFSNFRIALAIALRQKISKQHAPLLLHCRFGRDRTGIVVAFLVKLLVPSLPDSILCQEFLLSDLGGGDEDAVLEMKDKGVVFTELTLRNLPSVYEYIEDRRKMVFRGDEYKTTRKVLSKITKKARITQYCIPINAFITDHISKIDYNHWVFD